MSCPYRSTRLPSAKTMVFSSTTSGRLRSGEPSNVSRSPFSNISGLQPDRRSTVAARISHRYLVTLPSGPVTSK